MPPNPESDSTSDPEVAAAHREVELAKENLHESLADVSHSGRKALKDMARTARPLLIAAAVVVGAVVVFRLVRRARARRKPSFSIVRTPERSPIVKPALGGALRGALRVLATRLAEQATARLVTAVERGDFDARGDEEASVRVSTFASR